MEKVVLEQVPVTGLPLYEMQQLFHLTGNYSDIRISYITLLPGKRVPESGTGAHEQDEYSFFIEGEVYTESGDYKGVCRQGEATLIPRGERHWCENRTDKPCRLVCVLAK
ncbi:MAG TPA: cupin domain-containing protein [Clostridiales bacterium]|jgi:mannose-6-phosphate isomerase-like protein (cupin superfamily)|nr:cupin domain-containing protein [Clostridiales bacterium]